MLKQSHLVSLIRMADYLDKSKNNDKIAIADQIDNLISSLTIKKTALEILHPEIKSFLGRIAPNLFKDRKETFNARKQLMELRLKGRVKEELPGVSSQDVINAINIITRSLEDGQKVPTYSVNRKVS